MSLPDFSEPSPEDGYYDVFLSFRGIDTRKGFTSNLYHAMRRKEMHTFMDVDLLGEEIKHLFDMIAKSRMAVVIYSKEFASSHWCLKELEKIMQLKKEQNILLTPIFYKVNLDEVKHLTGLSGDYLDKHIPKHGETAVNNWKAAVTNFGNVSGISYKDNDYRSEHDFIEEVIGKIKKKLKNAKDVGSSSSDKAAADKQCFTYGEILKMTNNLEKLIGRGVLGDVYHGKLNGAAVAVKILPHSITHQHVGLGSDLLKPYLQSRLSIRHENLVSLVGYCVDDSKEARVYEFMPNGNLRMLLSEASPRVLTWKDRLKIAIDIAEGLKYLHGVPLTTNGNLQSTDIVFDEKMTAKILFFPCLRRAELTTPYDRYINSLYVEGASYMSHDNPLLREEFNKKLDLHCFAMILYELVTGRAPPPTMTWQSFVNILSQGNLNVDSRLAGVFNKVSIDDIIRRAFKCASFENMTKPSISDVLEDLKAQYIIVKARDWIMGR